MEMVNIQAAVDPQKASDDINGIFIYMYSAS